MSLITINKEQKTPIYKQIIESVEDGILNEELKKGDRLPSINSIRNKYNVSRDTVLLAYSELKIRGIVQSIIGKGYYIKSNNVQTHKKVFLLFDELNVFKEDLYTSFLGSIDKDNVQVDIYFHNFNYDVFSKLVYDNIGYYDYYVLMPANLKNIKVVIDKLPKEKVYILDQINNDLIGYNAIYQSFKEDVFNGLENALQLLKKYNSLTLVFEKVKQPEGMVEGFKEFCNTYHFPYKIINSASEATLKKGEVYVIPDNRNLVSVIKKIRELNFSIGKDVGIIAYNDSLIKDILEGGITTITTNFTKMGKRLAEMISNKEHVSEKNESTLIIRKSI
ncbi:GntR family transcriptional regulator [Tenacibaculum sp. UWU-22]|uniref:GntR family transcriptional regulator n=1 Tax=Tenacibaculum sp. UWU-22 TaxID=3234187 RepID=UPI0034DAE65C